jgi:hypothetical protein
MAFLIGSSRWVPVDGIIVGVPAFSINAGMDRLARKPGRPAPYEQDSWMRWFMNKIGKFATASR